MAFNEPAPVSNDPWPSVPSPQLSSMNRRMEVWSTRLWSTKLSWAYGDTTSSGSRSPYPHRISNTVGSSTGRDCPGGAMHMRVVWSLLVAGRTPYIVSRRGLWEWWTFGGNWWSYHPSESSHASTTAVEDHCGSCWI